MDGEQTKVSISIDFGQQVSFWQQHVYHWLMSKLVDEEGAATEGINTKQNYIDSQKAQTDETLHLTVQRVFI